MTSVALHRHSNISVDVPPPEADSSISPLSDQSEKLDVTYNDIRGRDIQKQEICEALELPSMHHELYKQIVTDSPRGVVLPYGPPVGIGKTIYKCLPKL